ncbi:MAG: ABC transporter permease subunit [Alphaproteobacteria bacterium]|nr:ABC transporter permease subunit [Alphaproteobacteria bacterium]
MSYFSSLWRNEQSRGILIQIFVLVAFFACFSWLISNVISNFATLNKGFGFDFLMLPAGYDINQTLIEYTNRSTHLRAAIVGLLNTFLVAGVGIVLATVLGFVLGVARLSRNWLISKLAYVYIEFTRNVPVLLHILLWHGIIVNTMPHPKKALTVGEVLFLTNRGLYVPKPIAETGIWLVWLGVVAALFFSVGFARYARARQRQSGMQLPVFRVNLAIWILLPLLAFFAAGQPISLSFPALKGFNFRGGIQLPPEFVALTFALSIYTAAFIGEIVRAGIIAVDKGQREAAEAIGLRPNQVMNEVILPQARRIIIPPLTSQYLNLTKNSSLAIAIGYMDIVATLGGITLNQTGREMEAMLMVMGIYLIISLIISAFMNWYNSRVRLVGR